MGQVYDSYIDLPLEARFAVARILTNFKTEYKLLRNVYSADEAEERMAWCLFGSFDSKADINVATGRYNYELSSHCDKCQYKKAFCRRVMPNLTKREQECFILMRKGLTDKEIANKLGISWLTVNKHFSNAINRLRDITEHNFTRQYIINELAAAGI